MVVHQMGTLLCTVRGLSGRGDAQVGGLGKVGVGHGEKVGVGHGEWVGRACPAAHNKTVQRRGWRGVVSALTCVGDESEASKNSPEEQQHAFDMQPRNVDEVE